MSCVCVCVCVVYLWAFVKLDVGCGSVAESRSRPQGGFYVYIALVDGGVIERKVEEGFKIDEDGKGFR